jgi:hypothetical protein
MDQIPPLDFSHLASASLVSWLLLAAAQVKRRFNVEGIFSVKLTPGAQSVLGGLLGWPPRLKVKGGF